MRGNEWLFGLGQVYVEDFIVLVVRVWHVESGRHLIDLTALTSRQVPDHLFVVVERVLRSADIGAVDAARLLLDLFVFDERSVTQLMEQTRAFTALDKLVVQLLIELSRQQF